MAELIKDMTNTINSVRRWGRIRAQQPSADAARELLAQVAAIGGDVEEVAARAGLAMRASEFLEGERTGRFAPFTAVQFARLYAECTWALDAHECVREGRSPLTKGEVDMLCYCVITCRDLRQVVERTIQFTAMLMPRMSRLTLHLAGEEAVFGMHTIRSQRGASGFVSDLTGLGMFYRLFSWLIGEDIRPLRAELCYDKYLSAATVARMLPCPISYACADNQLLFPAEYLDRAVVRTSRQLEGFLQHFPFDPEGDFSQTASLGQRILQIYEGELMQALPLSRGEAVAQLLGISGATLRRRLADEGTSLAALKAQCRRTLAEQLLMEGREPLENITQMVGFTDLSTFSRAFQGWHGMSPAQWRRTHMAARG